MSARFTVTRSRITRAEAKAEPSTAVAVVKDEKETIQLIRTELQ